MSHIVASGGGGSRELPSSSANNLLKIVLFSSASTKTSPSTSWGTNAVSNNHFKRGSFKRRICEVNSPPKRNARNSSTSEGIRLPQKSKCLGCKGTPKWSLISSACVAVGTTQNMFLPVVISRIKSVS